MCMICRQLLTTFSRSSSVEEASFTLLVKNYEDELELYFATRAESDPLGLVVLAHLMRDHHAEGLEAPLADG